MWVVLDFFLFLFFFFALEIEIEKVRWKIGRRLKFCTSNLFQRQKRDGRQSKVPPASQPAIHQEREKERVPYIQQREYLYTVQRHEHFFFSHGNNTLTLRNPSTPPPSPAYPSSPRPAPAPTVPPDPAAAAAVAAVASVDDTWTPNFRPTRTRPIHPVPSKVPFE